MSNARVAFEILPENVPISEGYSRSRDHLVFDVKINFTRKARWVKEGHKAPDSVWSTFAGVISRNSVRIVLTYAALSGFDVKVADIQNAYLQTPASEKHYVICESEFRIKNIGKVTLIKRALYGESHLDLTFGVT